MDADERRRIGRKANVRFEVDQRDRSDAKGMERAIRRFTKACDRGDVLREHKRSLVYIKPSTKRRLRRKKR
jgi:ribosomal protein S21